MLLLIMKKVTLLIYLPTQMQDVIEQNSSLLFTHQMFVALGNECAFSLWCAANLEFSWLPWFVWHVDK